MKRGLLNLLSVLSVAACAALVTFENASFVAEGRASFRTSAGYFFLYSRDGMLWLDGPPPRGTRSPRTAPVLQAIDRMRNDDLEWEVHYREDRNGSVVFSHVHARWRQGTPVDALVRAPVNRKDIARTLLEALESPDRLAAAHFFLGAGGHLSHEERGGRIHVDYLGLPVEFDASRARVIGRRRKPDVRYHLLFSNGAGVHIDPTRREAVRRHWHERLKVTWGSFPYWPLTLASVVLPAVRIISWWKRRWALRLNECPTCGYDLRETTGLCPECGERFPARKDPASSLDEHPVSEAPVDPAR